MPSPRDDASLLGPLFGFARATPLLPLVPAGIGTSDVEILTSYVARLADQHDVTVGDLLRRVVADRVPGIQFQKSGTVMSAFFRQSAAINGDSVLATQMVEALEVLTGVPSLRALTLLPWLGVLNSRGALRQHRAWCAACLDQLGSFRRGRK